MAPLNSLAAKLAFGILGGCLAVYLLILLDMHGQTRRMLEERIRHEGENVLDAAAARIDAELSRVEAAPIDLARVLGAGFPPPHVLERDLCASLAANPTVFGAAAAFEPGAFSPGLASFSPYCFREGGEVRFKDLGQGGYGYAERDWYRVPRDAGVPRWSEPYFDEGGGNVLMATYSVPILRAGPTGKRVVGIATSDVALSWLQSFMAGIRVGRSGYAFLLDRTSRIVTHPDRGLAMRASLVELAARSGDAGLARVAQAVPAGQRGFERAKDPATAAPSLLVFRPLQASGWFLAVVFPERESLAAVAALRDRMLASGAAGAAALVLVVVLLSRRITQPLSRLARAADQIAAGGLVASLPRPGSRDEVGRLTASFMEMQTALNLYVDEVRHKAAAEERLESELRVARQIQMSLLPSAADLRAERVGCDVFGMLEPAREVGGDLFDIVARPGELCFVIGDVSDKGIPASLFMAVTDIHFEAAARELRSPQQILARINDALVSENSANMFVTLACGILDTPSGRLALASGGHTRHLLVPCSGPARFVAGKVGTVLGVMAGLRFPQVELELGPGDALLLYTDGVTEAHDPDGRMFGEEGLLAHFGAQPPGRDARAMAQGLRDAVAAFARSAPQFDDIAILVVRRSSEPLGTGAASRLEIGSGSAELPRASQWLAEWCGTSGVSDEARHDLDLALDEVVGNVIRHGYTSDASARISLSLELDGEQVRLTIADRAPAFDPLGAAAPGERAHAGGGGLGIELVRRHLDHVAYTRENGENRLVLSRRRWGRAAPGGGSGLEE